jgi:hypothetical protein
MALQRSHTATIARNERWSGNDVVTEPYEAGWAHEAIFFVRALEAEGNLQHAVAHIQISPDGIHWIDEGTAFALPLAAGELGFGRVTQFGTYLRLRVRVPDGAALRVVAALALKE